MTLTSVILNQFLGGYAPDLVITDPVLTSKWFEGSNFVQILEMKISNTNPSNYLTLADTLNVTMTSPGLTLVRSSTLTRLAPGQEVVVQLGVQNAPNTPRGSECSGTVFAAWGQSYGVRNTTQNFSGYCGIPDYDASTSSLGHHWTPDWYNDVKFGIFIHWGLYSVPAYGSVQPNEDYAEWYWCRMHDPSYKTHTYQYHAGIYGENFEYDQFIDNFTDTGYDPKSWVDIFAAAGARYIVPVTSKSVLILSSPVADPIHRTS